MQYVELFQSRSAAFDEDGILLDMTESMRRDVLLHINQEVIRTATLLRRAPMPLVVHMISALTPAFALPDEIVLQVVVVRMRLCFLCYSSPCASLVGGYCECAWPCVGVGLGSGDRPAHPQPRAHGSYASLLCTPSMFALSLPASRFHNHSP
jgi:hypothetical protein